MKIKLRLFASFRQVFNSSEIEFTLSEGATAQDLLNEIFSKHKELERFRGHVVVTINRQAVQMTAVIHEGDEVAILPPVSGG